MRRLVLVALLAVAALIAWAATRSTGSKPPLAVSVSSGLATPDPEDTNILGLRLWSVAAYVHVRARTNCRDVRLALENERLFDRARVSRDRRHVDLGAMRVGASRTVSGDAGGDTGEIVLLKSTATCDGRTVSATRRLPVPAESCFGGPLHVYAARRAVRVDDAGHAHPLRPGDFVRDETVVRVSRRGSALIGATECNNFHVQLGPGQYFTGEYNDGGRGDGFYGRNALVVTDEHGGGFAIAGKAIVQPMGRPCAQCAPPPVSFEARTQSRRRATVRVDGGAVRIVTGEHLRSFGTAVAGQQIDILCRRDCDLTRPRLWQPGEPWTTPPHYRPAPLARVLHVARPPDAELAPLGARVTVHDLPAGRDVPEQLAAVWERDVRTGAGRAAGYLQPQYGLIIWQRTGPLRWRRVFSRTFRVYDSPPAVTTADVTGDRHPDILVVVEQGSAACGPREVFATVRERVRRIFYRNECESGVLLKGGRVQLDEPVGRCPFKEGSAHCFGGFAHITEEWNGRRLVVVARKIRCNWPRLNPATDCNRRRAP